jgi:spermidine synthase
MRYRAGLGLWILSDLTNNIIAIDINLNGIDIARRIFLEVEFVVADAYKYIEQIEPGKFDVLISAHGPIY